MEPGDAVRRGERGSHSLPSIDFNKEDSVRLTLAKSKRYKSQEAIEPEHIMRCIDKKEIPPVLQIRSGPLSETPHTETPPDENTMKDFAFILKDPFLCACFRKYLQQTYSEENLDFYKSVDRFRDLLDPEDRRKEAKEIYEEFISEKSAREVNISQEYKSVIKRSLDAEPDIPPTFFDMVQLEIYHTMKRDSYRQYILHKNFKDCCNFYYNVHRMGDDDMKHRTGLTDRDWRFLLTGAKEVTIEPGTQIITMNQNQNSMYRLKSGTLRVFKPLDNDEEHTICFLDSPGTVVGELSVLGNYGFATASVVCHTSCVLHQCVECWLLLCPPSTISLGVELPFISKLFEREAELARRFYISVGKNLSKLLSDISSLTSGSVKSFTQITNDAQEEPPKHEREFHDIFSLPESELLIKHTKCSYDKVIVRKGNLYISSRGIYFYSKIFSQKTKERILLDEINSADIREKGKSAAILRIETVKGRFHFILKRDEGQIAESLINDLRQVHNPNSKPKSPTFERKESLSEDDIMSESDWDVILAGDKQNSDYLMTFSEGDVILEEGKRYMMVCQIASGSCRIEKRVPDSKVSVILGTMNEGEIFGEINFLTGHPATASVIAESRVDMYVIGPAIEEIFSRNPGVVVRFYHHLCVSLAKRIVQRENEGWGRGVVDVD